MEELQLDATIEKKPRKARAKTEKVKKEKSPFQKYEREAKELIASGADFKPGPDNPVCRKCALFASNCRSKYLEPVGPDRPLITIITEGPSQSEDENGRIGQDKGVNSFLRKTLSPHLTKLGLKFEDTVRIAPITRCFPGDLKKSAKSAGRYCRLFLTKELRDHPPALVMAVGSNVLGLLNIKSNAQDWNGRILNWRGWPDDFLISKTYDGGHPILGDRPSGETQIPILAIQSPKIVFTFANQISVKRWNDAFVKAAAIAKAGGVETYEYDRPWWILTEDPEAVRESCQYLIDNPGTLLSFDTETTGLHPFKNGNKIVYFMFRWNELDGTDRSVGWAWDYEGSPLKEFVAYLSPFILRALSASKLRGHNLTFDILFVIGTLPGGRDYIEKICSAFWQDSWHMRYIWRQETGSMGLEVIAYDWAPTLAGYEERMTMLIDKYPELLHPDSGGHYANCPKEYWDTAFKPYVMGDVEVCWEACEGIDKRLELAKTYRIPLAHTENRGAYRLYSPPSRKLVYDCLMRPAGDTLARMMARGMHVDVDELTRQEVASPDLIRNAIKELQESDPQIDRWVKIQKVNNPDWELDVEDKKQLRTILFNLLQCPVNTLTEAGDKRFKGVPIDQIPMDQRIEFASMDKFTLNNLSVGYPQVRPLINYRKLRKAYSSYIRPMRNLSIAGVDKKDRTAQQLLMDDGCVHASFKLTGTRGGRLSCCVSADTVLNLQVNGFTNIRVRIKDLGKVLAKYRNTRIQTHTGHWQRILCHVVKPKATMYRVITSRGYIIKATSGHRFLTPSGWSYLLDLDIGDIVKIASNANGGHDTIVSKDMVGYETVHDMHVEEDNSYVAQGFINHNTNPNLQQIPRESGGIKRLYSSRFKERGCIFQSDLSQIELRLLAAACGDSAMVKAYVDDVDLHSQTTSLVFNIPYETFSDDHQIWLQKNGKADEVKKLAGKRKLGKILNFLTGYGGGALGFQSACALAGVYLQLDECEKLLENFFAAYPDLKTHIGHYKRFVQDNGCAVSITGRVRIFEEVFSDDKQRINKALRSGYNHLIQSTASDMMLFSLIAIERLMEDYQLESKLICTVHDSLVIDAITDELPQVHEICDSVFKNMPDVISTLVPGFDTSWCIVPFDCDHEVGYNYMDAVKVPKRNVDWDDISAGMKKLVKH